MEQSSELVKTNTSSVVPSPQKHSGTATAFLIMGSMATALNLLIGIPLVLLGLLFDDNGAALSSPFLLLYIVPPILCIYFLIRGFKLRNNGKSKDSIPYGILAIFVGLLFPAVALLIFS